MVELWMNIPCFIIPTKECLFVQLEIITCPFPPVVLSVFWDELLLLFLLIEKCGIGYAGYASHVKASCYVVLLRVLVLT